MRIKHINISGSQVPLTSLNIIVGPNGVGKTTLLRDLHGEFIQRPTSGGDPARWVNLLDEDSFEASRDDWREWRSSLRIITGEGYDSSGKYYADLKSLGRHDKPQKVKDIALTEIDQAIGGSWSGHPVFPEQTHHYSYSGASKEIIVPFKDQRSVFMTVDGRLDLSNNGSGNHDIDMGGSIQPAPFLAENSDILKSINSKMTKLFGKKIFTESRKLPEFSLYVGRSDIKQPKRYSNSPRNIRRIAETFDEWVRQNNVVSLRSEGHGVRAAVQILYELENTSNKIVFIDEPELHLYPSAKYMLGRFIGEYAKQGKKQVVITTHDTDMLRGLIEASSRATIIRINRDRSVRFVKDDSIHKTIAGSVLQSAFLDAVIVVEGVQDRYVYGGVLHHNNLLQNISYQVIGVNGKESVSQSFYFFDLLGIKYAAIYDFDFFWHNNKGAETARACLDRKKVDGLTKSSLLSMSSEICDFMKGKEEKKRGLNSPALSHSQRQKIISCLSIFAKEGIFISSVGELEDWVNVNKNMGKDMASAEKILQKYKARNKTTYKGLTDFMRSVAAYIERDGV